MLNRRLRMEATGMSEISFLVALLCFLQNLKGWTQKVGIMPISNMLIRAKAKIIIKRERRQERTAYKLDILSVAQGCVGGVDRSFFESIVILNWTFNHTRYGSICRRVAAIGGGKSVY